MMRENLRHKVTVTPTTGVNDHGVPQYGAPVTGVRCYIDGTTRRFVNERQEDIQATWQVFFEGKTDIGNNYKLSSGQDRDGNTLLSSARVIAIDDNVSGQMGRLLRTAFCAVQ